MCFLTNTNAGYNRHGEQFAHGDFLIVVQDPNGDSRDWVNAQGKTVKVPELRCLVRYVRMTQCGHFMMATVKVGPYKFVLSGDYGSDGLPKHLPHTSDFSGEEGRRLTPDEVQSLWAKFHPIPSDLQDAFWSGGGHNAGGSERPSLRAWARPQTRALKRL